MQDNVHHFESLALNSKIDHGSGIVSGVCAIKIGEAKGWDWWIDATTLKTALDVLSQFSEGIKVKLRHSTAGQYTDIVQETFGLMKNFRIDGEKLIGDLHVLQSVAAEVKGKFFEMCEKMADQFGLSIAFKGWSEKRGDKNYLRCKQVCSIDLTENPAATNGLFSMSKSIKFENNKDGAHAKDCHCEECASAESTKKMQALEVGLQALTASVAALTAKVAAPANAADPVLAGQLEGVVKQFLEKATLQAAETVERKEIIGQLQRDGRVVFNEQGVAFKLQELETLPMIALKLVAKNSAVIPTRARAIYSGAGAGPSAPTLTKKERDKSGAMVEVALQGEELLAAVWDEQYGDIDKMLANAAKHSN